MVLDDDAHGLFLADNEAWHSIPSGDADISSQLPLPSSPHYQNSGYQREKLEERDKAGDNSDFVAETPSFGTLAVPFVVVGFGFLLSLFGAFNFSEAEDCAVASFSPPGCFWLLSVVGLGGGCCDCPHESDAKAAKSASAITRQGSLMRPQSPFRKCAVLSSLAKTRSISMPISPS